MVSNTILKKSGIYLIGNLSSKIMTALLIPIYAFYIDIKDLGYYDFSQTVMGILSPIIVLAVWEAVLKFILSEDDLKIKKKIMTTSALFTLSMTLLFALFVIVLSFTFKQSINHIFLITLMIILHTIVYVWQYYSRAYGNNKLFIIAGISSTIVNFLCIILFIVILKMELLGLLLAYNIGQVSIIIIIEIKIGVIRGLKLKEFDFNILKRMLIFSSPLVLNLISAWLISGYGRMIITLKLGTEANGLYSFANKFSLLITMLGSVVTMAIIEEAILLSKVNKINENFNKTIESLFMIFQTIALLMVPAIVIFYEFIAKTDYYSSVFFAPGLLIYSVSNTMASNMGSVFQAINKTKYQFLTTLMGGIVTVLVSMFFIERFGVFAVVMGQILGATTILFYRYILINKFIVMKINWKSILAMLVAFIIVSLVCINSNFMISFIIESILIVLVIYTNRMLIYDVWNKIRIRR